MKKLILFMVFFIFINCEKEKAINSSDEFFFQTEKISSLSLENINGFWKENLPKITSNNMGKAINDYSGFLEGIEIRTDDFSQQVQVFVFNSKKSALEFMEKRDKYFSAHIDKGEDHELINDNWWYLKWDNVYGVFLNQWNTIICVNYTFKSNGDTEKIAINTALEICRRIDSLSN